MYKFLKSLFYLFLIVLAFSGCRKAALDAYYGRPATLAPPIYQTLQAKGNFTNMLVCIDKAGYTSQLSTAGYWTLFAANDDAFKKANIDANQLDVATATKIVTYSLVNSGYVSSPLADIRPGNISGNNIEVAQLAKNLDLTSTLTPAYKRRTTYHDGVDTTTVPNIGVYGSLAGQNIKSIAQNSPVSVASLINASQSAYYDPKDLNNKYIPYFTPYYFNANGLTSYDYTFFYPGATFTNDPLKFNVLGGNVIDPNIICENGVLQVINTVPLPLPSLETYLKSKSDYSHFYNFIQQYGNLVTYAISPDATRVNQVNTGSSASVYVKQYSPLLAFSPANENLFSGGGSTWPQYNSNTLFAPNNAAFDSYVNTVLLEHYPNLASLPQSVIVDFINAHMATSTIWPSQFSKNGILNAKGENPRFNANTDVKDQMVCSNGLFYGTTKAQATNVFATVYGRIYLDPDYSIMAKAFSFFTSFRTNLTNPAFKYTVVMIPDVTLRALGYGINASAGGNTTPGSGITFTLPSGSTTAGSEALLLRTLNLGIFLTPNNELSNLSGTGIYATAGLNSAAPEVVKYSNNQFFAAGNQDANTTVTVNPAYITCSNGIVYYPVSSNNNILIPTPVANSVGTAIFNKGQVAPVNGVGGDPYYMFYKYLSGTLLWNSSTKAIQGIDIGTDYTIMIPSNTAMQDAVNNGWLPGTGSGAVKTPNFAPSAPADVSLVSNFIKYHIIKANQIIPDGKKSGRYVTMLFSNDGNNVATQFNNNLNNLQVIDGQFRVANVGPVNSIVLADRTVILSIDNYLQYLDSTGITPNNPNPTKY
ncbi:hypothetical protein KXQ82_05420 [Mucilaginibacter sp. HMF5004]|uniref:hypothetical protein n=1 Tax=Mucilaginibacter rivuli TaxID=2857527 RepID=UPI001C5CDCBE|nr:hypothetical protein [Mucilaginibacter rivuli]MBW4889142.1 hypothetical protein [Mucilaginibacter rivuli]